MSAFEAPGRGSPQLPILMQGPLEEGEVMVCWLGQAGFAIRTRSALLAIDPYLSDAAEVTAGIARLQPSLVRAADISPHLLLISHSHADHFDVPTITPWAASRKTHLVAPAGVVRQAVDDCGWDRLAVSAIAPGETMIVGGVEVTATFARHSDSGVASAETVGFLFRVAGVTIWHSGDTVYDERLRQIAPPATIDLALLPINGTGGNMNAHEAALLAWLLGVRLALPMHFGMWADDDYTYQGTEPDATLDPQIFADTYRRLAGVNRSLLAAVGSPVVIRRRGEALDVRLPEDLGQWPAR